MYQPLGPQISAISKLIFNYLDLTNGESVGLFKENKLKAEALTVGNGLSIQALSWTDLNVKEAFRHFISQGKFPGESSIVEILLLFNSFLNCFLLRLKDISKLIKVIQSLFKEFFSIKELIYQGLFNRSPTQRKVISEKISFLENKIMSEAELLFNLQMDHRFQNIIPFITDVRPYDSCVRI